LTWVECECGCGFEGEDEVTQFCIEEAAALTLDLQQAAELEAEQAPPAPRPGEITDPAVQEAMAAAKRLHAQTHGVQIP
jgi:hypothetical protein